MNYADAVITCSAAAVTLFIFAAAVVCTGGRRSRRSGGSDDGGGGGAPVRTGPRPPDHPSGYDEPSWWPEFERDLERWARERRTRGRPVGAMTRRS